MGSNAQPEGLGEVSHQRQTCFVWPVEVRDGPQIDALSKQRYTFVTFDDGTLDVVEDNWGGEGANRVLARAWTGETWFYVDPEDPKALN